MPRLNMVQALNSALAIELERDSRVVVFGVDVGKAGGVFRVTDGLQARFGELRVFDTPLAESGIVGSAIGMATYGLKPVAEIQFAGFLFVCMDQLASQAARWRTRSGGVFTCPLVVRSPWGGGVRAPEMHSDSMESRLTNIPGLKVVIPSSPFEAKGLLTAAIDDPDPVIFLEHMKLYRSIREEVPSERYTISLGEAHVVRKGSDVSVFAYGAMVHAALEAATQVQAEHGVSAEVVDLRTISPLDETTIAASASKTGRVVIVHEAPRAYGVAAEVTQVVCEQAFYNLQAPPSRVTGYDVPFPTPVVEDIFVPTPARIARAILAQMAD
jgi:pyruvate dehydrogenase E1 component beta subunit